MTEMIVKLKLVEAGKAIKASADVTLLTDFGEVTLYRFRIIQKDDREPWISYPQITYEKDGKTRYLPIVDASVGFKRQLESRIMEEYNRQVKEL